MGLGKQSQKKTIIVSIFSSKFTENHKCCFQGLQVFNLSYRYQISQQLWCQRFKPPGREIVFVSLQLLTNKQLLTRVLTRLQRLSGTLNVSYTHQSVYTGRFLITNCSNRLINIVFAVGGLMQLERLMLLMLVPLGHFIYTSETIKTLFICENYSAEGNLFDS